ncbi:hypothetical protein PsYK624_152820 [Phanerochaete sordida]|uniref:Uncharacterized protein n=1 Tax=Phanerochaete sordida TaxID=48140 RepID=A0A9P3LM66_9APHY|nr:hypothetical protein PsYK624_152820 [Phanerochaete sordida]
MLLPRSSRARPARAYTQLALLRTHHSVRRAHERCGASLGAEYRDLGLAQSAQPCVTLTLPASPGRPDGVFVSGRQAAHAALVPHMARVVRPCPRGAGAVTLADARGWERRVRERRADARPRRQTPRAQVEHCARGPSPLPSPPFCFLVAPWPVAARAGGDRAVFVRFFPENVIRISQRTLSEDPFARTITSSGALADTHA